jgi:hypothetical protein
MYKPPKAYKNKEFLASRDARELRILAEYIEPKTRFIKNDIRKAIVFFGSARLVDSTTAQKMLDESETESDKTNAKRLLKMAPYYENAQLLAKLITEWTLKEHKGDKKYYICTGGGPGIMEASNKGAAEIDKNMSIGLNISLPFEQYPNEFIGDEVNMEFHYFFMRKFWFMALAEALIVFPGGFGTCDELFEAMTLIQTEKKRKMPIILFNKDFWTSLINFDYFLESGLISKEDLDLFQFVDSPEEAMEILKQSL